MTFRPHILKWTTPDGEPIVNPDTGHETPGSPGELREVPCRYRLSNVKTFKNEDNTDVQQVGTIRVNSGSDMPLVGSLVEVVELNTLEVQGEPITVGGANLVEQIIHFTGTIKQIYTGGQLGSWRMDV